MDDPGMQTTGEQEQTLLAEIIRLNKIIQALMNRAERSTLAQNSDFSLFQTAVILEDEVHRRTEELEAALRENEKIYRELRKSSEEIEDLYNNAPCGYHSLDEHGLFVRINNTELAWLGYRRDEVIGKMNFLSLLTPESLQTFQASYPCFKETGYMNDLELELLRKDGSVLPGLVNATAIRDDAGNFSKSRSTLFDLTERKKLESRLTHQANTDVLTGLNNRRHFFELAEQELVRSKRYGTTPSVLLLDVDHFKLINDKYGHPVGDRVLQKLGEACGEILREIDILGRIGGEEFVILLPETKSDQAMEVAERVRLAIAGTAVQLEHDTVVNFSVSIGVSSLEILDVRIEDMLKRADVALYAAKKAGRNQVRG